MVTVLARRATRRPSAIAKSQIHRATFRAARLHLYLSTLGRKSSPGSSAGTWCWNMRWDHDGGPSRGLRTFKRCWHTLVPSYRFTYVHALRELLEDPKSVWGRRYKTTSSDVNLLAVIVGVITAILIRGISESASFNAIMVGIKLFAVLFVIIVGHFASMPTGCRFPESGPVQTFSAAQHRTGSPLHKPVGMLAGAAIILFAYIGFRLGFNPRGRGQESQARCAHGVSFRSWFARSCTSRWWPCSRAWSSTIRST